MSWQELHKSSQVCDLHIHPTLKAMLFHRGLATKHKRKWFGRACMPLETRSDFPKMMAGSLNVGLVTAYVPEQGWLDDLWVLRFIVKYLKPSVYKRVFEPDYMTATIDCLDELEAQVTNYQWAEKMAERPSRIRCATTPAQMDEGLAAGELCLVHAIEGAHMLHGPVCGKLVPPTGGHNQEACDEMLANLERLHQRGVACLTLAHFYPNRAVSPVFPYPEFALKWAKREMWTKWDHTKGLTPAGEQVVERMFELGMILDVSHCTPVARARIYQLAEHHKRTAGVIATHMGVTRMNSDPYNLQDWEVRWIAQNGGVVGVIFMNYWLTGECRKLGVRYVVDTMRHLADIGGEGVVAFGSDFDGFTDPPDDMQDISELSRLTQQLVAECDGAEGRRDDSLRRWPDEVVSKFIGGNAVRVLREGWKV